MQTSIDAAADLFQKRQLVDATGRHGFYSKLVADRLMFGLNGTQTNGSIGMNPSYGYSNIGPEPKDRGGQGRGLLNGSSRWEYLEYQSLKDWNDKMVKKQKLSSAAGSTDIDLSLSLAAKATDPSAARKEEEEEDEEREKGSWESSSEITDDLSLSLFSAGSSRAGRVKRRLMDLLKEGDSGSEEGLVNEFYSCSSDGGLKTMMRASTLDLTL